MQLDENQPPHTAQWRLEGNCEDDLKTETVIVYRTDLYESVINFFLSVKVGGIHWDDQASKSLGEYWRQLTR